MFVLAKSSNYLWPIKYRFPVSGGIYQTMDFELEFKRIPQSRIKEIVETKNLSNEEFAKEVVCGWKGVSDDSGKAISFSETAFCELLDFPSMSANIIQVYMESLQGSLIKN